MLQMMEQMTEKGKTSGGELKVEISNQSNKEFKIMIIKMLKKFKRRLDKQTDKLEVFNKK